MKFTVVTILPELIEPALTAGVVGRAKEAGTITVSTVNPRDFTHDRHRTVDDTPYGGGQGMVMKPEPLLAAIDAAIATHGPGRRIFMSPSGAPLTQAKVRELSAHPHLVLVCGRYEGIDERVVELAIDEEISIGDYVLSGGELGALVVIDAVSRLVPGVLGASASAVDESFSHGTLEYPQYTRPPTIHDKAVPPILMSGNHGAIDKWRRAQAIERTRARRPDLLGAAPPVAPAPPRDAVLALAARTHLALVHHPVVDRNAKIVTTAVTNFDIHDLARSSMTYGLAGYHIVTPVTSQRDKAEHIATLWIQDDAGEHRARALELVRTAPSIEEVISTLSARASESATELLVVVTSARAESFPGVPRRTPAELVREASEKVASLLIILGTGWGLADAMIPSVSRVLTPIEGASSWNHLSVRSAGAILLDRLFGRAA